MEESLDIFGIIRDTLDISDVDADTYSPLTLAYIGDAIYDIVIRTMVVAKSNMQVNKLHKKSSGLVNAGTQADIIKYLMDNGELTDKEISVYKRGRNAKSFTKAKNATVIDYRMATGFEALMGYLYLKGESGRMLGLIKNALDNIEGRK